VEIDLVRRELNLIEYVQARLIIEETKNAGIQYHFILKYPNSVSKLFENVWIQVNSIKGLYDFTEERYLTEPNSEIFNNLSRGQCDIEIFGIYLKFRDDQTRLEVIVNDFEHYLQKYYSV
jgi:hypothetical protein